MHRILNSLPVTLGCLTFIVAGNAPATEFYSDWATNHMSDIPAQSGPFHDPDGDRETNVVEFCYGTDPRVPDGIHGALTPQSGGGAGIFDVEVYLREGQRYGVQLDLDVSSDLAAWIRPWWQRTSAPSLPSDPTNSARMLLSTRLRATNAWFARSSVQLLEVGPEMASYYVATNGSDSNPGTGLAQPFATLHKAVGLANPGDLIYVRGGTYHWTQKVRLSRSGTEAQPIRIRAYPGERPIFDFSGQVVASTNRGIEMPRHYWHLYGLEIVGCGDNGINLQGKSNIVERCITHHTRDTGIQISANGAYNLILNCDSYRNYDAHNHGENADGFAAKGLIGPGNRFSGCRAWENSDDGWDFWEAPETVILENSWAFRHGINYWNDPAFTGNGNGFKLGGNYVPGAHRISRCVAFANVQTGFDQNNNTAGQIVDQNTAWANGSLNFHLAHGPVTQGVHIIRNNLSIDGFVEMANGSLPTNNSWQMPTPSTNDVLSVDVALALSPRREDGGLPEVPFLRPVPGGRLVNRGVYLGEPFSGSAPDLGAFETMEW